MPPRLRDLFLAFFVASLTAFGGALPWVRRMLVERRRWITEEEFTNTMALCQFLPGPNIINMAIAVGTRFRGLPGAAACILGLLVAPVTMVIGLGAIYGRYAETAAMRGMLAGIGAAAAGLIAATAIKMAMPVLRARPLTAAPVMALAFIGVGITRFPLVWVLAVLAPIGIAVAWKSR